MYKWDFSWVWTYRHALFDAFLVTLWLNAIVLLIGSLLGFVVALARRTRYSFLRAAALLYIDFFRTLPVLVLLVWFFFCVPILLGGIRISSVVSAIIVLSLNLSAFVAAIVRTGIESVPK